MTMQEGSKGGVRLFYMTSRRAEPFPEWFLAVSPVLATKELLYKYVMNKGHENVRGLSCK